MSFLASFSGIDDLFHLILIFGMDLLFGRREDSLFTNAGEVVVLTGLFVADERMQLQWYGITAGLGCLETYKDLVLRGELEPGNLAQVSPLFCGFFLVLR